MKRKNIILAFMSIMTMLITVQSCKKDDAATPTVFVAAVPENPTPAVDAVVALAGTTYTIKWAGTASAWDIYLGTTSKPSLVKAGAIGNSYTFTTAVGGEFFWYVKTVDANKVTSKSTLWNFYINSAPTVPSLTAPVASATAVSVKGAITWSATDAEGDALTYDLYLGKTATPGIAAAGLTAATYTPALDNNTTYYWKVVATDVHGAKSESAVRSFTTDIFRPDFSVFNGVASELCPTFSATAKKDVYVQINTTTSTITLYLPLADGMVSAGWGTKYFGAHPITITYNPTTFAVTSTKQLWTDSFIDPEEMGPMSLKAYSGTIDATNKKISIRWTVSGNAYWGPDYTMSTTTYTMK
jgi:hypothetical protein